MSRQDPKAAALEIVAERFADARVTFLGGSVIRKEATATSDLDLVVVYERVDTARRESFLHRDWPVEAFVHDPETLRYFFLEVDRPSGVPSLPDMVARGLALPAASDFSRSLQALAEEVIALGPPAWSEQELAASRYAITDLVDDLRTPKSTDELLATATQLYCMAADHFFRAQRSWSAKGKSIPRRLTATAPQFAEQFSRAFRDVFNNGRTQAVIDLCEQLLAPQGGWLFAGYRAEAPTAWRLSGTSPAGVPSDRADSRKQISGTEPP